MTKPTPSPSYSTTNSKSNIPRPALLTRLQEAYRDGTPLIVVTGQPATSGVGSGACQEADVIGTSRRWTKSNVMVKDVSELPRRINAAFKIATSARPGPVLVHLPNDITPAILRTPIPLTFTQPDLIDRLLPSNYLRPRPWPSPAESTPNSNSAPSETRELRQAADMIVNAKRPLIYAGQGILSSDEGPKLLRQLADQWNIPVTTTLMGRGASDEEGLESLHMLGIHDSAYPTLAMQDADVLIVLGARLDERVAGKVNTFAPRALAAAQQGRGGITHFEIQLQDINKGVRATCSVEGDVVQSLTHLLNILPARMSPPERTEWRATIQGWKDKYPSRPNGPSSHRLQKPNQAPDCQELPGSFLPSLIGPNNCLQLPTPTLVVRANRPLLSPCLQELAKRLVLRSRPGPLSSLLEANQVLLVFKNRARPGPHLSSFSGVNQAPPVFRNRARPTLRFPSLAQGPTKWPPLLFPSIRANQAVALANQPQPSHQTPGPRHFPPCPRQPAPTLSPFLPSAKTAIMHQQFLNMRRFSMIHPAFNARKKPLIPTDSALAGFIEMFDEKHKETATALVEKAESLLAYERHILASERQIQQNFRESMAKAQQSLCEQWEMTHKLSNQIIEMSRERLAQSNAEILRLTSQLTPQGAFKYYEEVHLTGINGPGRSNTQNSLRNDL
ncbi:hypothetical protein PtB15_5B834 [Puccinia triticina]|nr:hypothetical protein PtB15_5B834 [Puccinia triticina]